MLDFLTRELLAWLHSPQRAGQTDAFRYLAGKHDILTRERTVIGKDGRLSAARNLPNNRLVDNQYGKLVRQKVNYLAGRDFSFAGGASALETFFDRHKRRIIHSVCTDSVNAGIGWLAPCFDTNGHFLLKRIPPYELLPFWADSQHTVLDAAARVYDCDTAGIFSPLDNSGLAPLSGKTVRRVELFTKDGISRFTLEGNRLVPDNSASGDSGSWLTAGGKSWGWSRVPLIPFKSPGEEPLLNRVKSLQDALNTLLSDFQNNLQEDARNTILILKNYDGSDLAEFRANLAAYGAVKVKTVDNTQGGVETLRVDFNHESYQSLAATLKRAIVENGMGFDTRVLHGTPNQLTLMSMYSDIELDAHALESEWKASFESLLWFVGAAMIISGKAPSGSSPECFAQTEVVFNRDMLLNESDIMKTLISAGLKISNESLLAQVPWVRDAGAEMDKLRKEVNHS